MTWTPVDLATIAGILDTLSVDPHAPTRQTAFST